MRTINNKCNNEYDDDGSWHNETGSKTKKRVRGQLVGKKIKRQDRMHGDEEQFR